MSELDQACVYCGGDVLTETEAADVRVGRRSATVEQDTTLCVACGQRYVTPEQLETTQLRAVEAIRGREGLMQPASIRRLRSSLGLSQAKLEKLLGVGPKTVVRWEKGSVIPNSATNTLLRLLEVEPAVANRLAEWHEVELRAEVEVTWSSDSIGPAMVFFVGSANDTSEDSDYASGGPWQDFQEASIAYNKQLHIGTSEPQHDVAQYWLSLSNEAVRRRKEMKLADHG